MDEGSGGGKFAPGAGIVIARATGDGPHDVGVARNGEIAGLIPLVAPVEAVIVGDIAFRAGRLQTDEDEVLVGIRDL